MQITYPSAEVLGRDHTLTQLTDIDLPDKVMRCHYGTVPWKRYLELEAERIRSRDPNRTTIIARHRNGALSLWVDDIAERCPKYHNYRRKVV